MYIELSQSDTHKSISSLSDCLTDKHVSNICKSCFYYIQVYVISAEFGVTYIYPLLRHIYKIYTAKTYIKNWPLQANKEIHHHNTRHADELHTHRALHMFAEKCLRYNVIRVVNNSPLCILDKLNTHSLTGFANYAKHVFIQKYEDKCIIQNCYTCLFRNNANTNR